MPKSQQELNDALLRALDPAVIKSLLKAGADATAVDSCKRTTLFYQDNPESIRLLLKAGADPKVVNISGETALFDQRNSECIRLLLEAGADPKAIDLNNQTVLFGQKNPKCIVVLLEAGADPTVVSNDGVTALFHHINPQCVRLLLAAGADPNAINTSGQTALFFQRNHECVKLLLEAGTDPTVVNLYGQTAKSTIHNTETIKLLEFAEDIYNAEKGVATISDPTAELEKAIVYGIPILCAKLVELGADITDFVSYAIEHTSSYEVFEFLLTKSLQGLDSEQRAEKIADLVKEVDPDTGTTQLMECISSLTRFSSKEAWVARTKVAIKLIELGADVNAVSHAGFHVIQLLANAFTVAKALDNTTVVEDLRTAVFAHIDMKLLSANIAEVDPDIEATAVQSEVDKLMKNIMSIGAEDSTVDDEESKGDDEIAEGSACAVAQAAMAVGGGVAAEDVDLSLLASAGAPASGMTSSESKPSVDVTGADSSLTTEESA